MRTSLTAASLVLLSQATALPASVAHAGTSEMTPRGFIHIRPEVRTNPGFTEGQDDTLMAVHQSARIGMDVVNGPFRAVIDIQGTEDWGGRSSTTSTAPTVYPYQAYVQVGTGDNWLRVGREEHHLLNGWHMSRAPWNVAGRSFDGITGHVKAGKWDVLAFTAVLGAPFAKTDVDDTTSGLSGPATTAVGPSLGETHAGLFATWTASDDLQISPIQLMRFGGPTLDDPDRQMWWTAPGFRLYVTPNQTEVDLVALGQVGDLSGTPLLAYSVILRGRQGLGTGKRKPGIGLILEQDSGSACTSATACDPGISHDFQTGFGRNHTLRGTADQFRGTNVRDLGLTGDTTLWDRGDKHKLTTGFEAHLFQLANPEGVWLNASGDVQGTGWEVGNTDPNLAWEVDALMDLWVSAVVHIDAGVSVVQPIGVGARLTGDDAQTYAFARNRFTF